MKHRFILAIGLSVMAIHEGNAAAVKTNHDGSHAQQVLGRMNMKADPCKDFYEYSCGKWIEENPLPADKDSLVQFEIVQDQTTEQLKKILGDKTLVESVPESSVYRRQYKKMQQIYSSCMDVASVNAAGIKPMEDQVKSLLRTHEKTQSLTTKIIFMKLKGLDTVFTRYISADLGKSTKKAIFLSQPDLTLPIETYQDEETVKEYTGLVTKYFETIIGKMDASVVGQILSGGQNWSQVAEEVVKLEKSFASASEKPPKNFNNTVTIDQLQEKYPFVNWNQYLNETIFQFQKSKFDAGKVTVFDMVPPYLAVLNKAMLEANQQTLQHYHIWKMLESYTPLLSDQFRAIDDKLQTLKGGRKERPARFKECVNFVDTHMGFVLGNAFVDHAFKNKNATEEIKQMVHDIRDSFRSRLPTLPWMSPVDAKKASEKESKIKEKLLFPELLKNESYVADQFDDLKVDSKDYFSISMSAGTFTTKHTSGTLSKPVDVNEWRINPQTVNAKFIPSQNEMQFPAGIFAAPFFDSRAPLPMQYGAIGTLVGHELTHGFDSAGRMFDSQGTLNPWWTEETTKKFNERASCFVQQYSQYKTSSGKSVNGNLTLNENIADNGGIRLAWEAYKTRSKTSASHLKLSKSELNGDQLFFVGFAQIWCGKLSPRKEQQMVLQNPHSPFSIRVKGVLENMPEFEKTFSCPTRKDRCTIW